MCILLKSCVTIMLLSCWELECFQMLRRWQNLNILLHLIKKNLLLRLAKHTFERPPYKPIEIKKKKSLYLWMDGRTCGLALSLDGYCLPLKVSNNSLFSSPQILPGQFLYKVRHDTLCRKHRLTFKRSNSKVATTTRSQNLWHKQVLNGVAERIVSIRNV